MTLEKIRLKGGAKRYKRGPGPTGAVRLQRRARRLALDAARLARRVDVGTESAYAARLAGILVAFLGGITP